RERVSMKPGVREGARFFFGRAPACMRLLERVSSASASLASPPSAPRPDATSAAFSRSVA
ncbi:TPA: hypothetical protein ACKFZV_005589, partial [Burkholderia multivorans]